MKTNVILLTGGKGSRISELSYPKQLHWLAGKPLFVHSLLTYERMDLVNEIYLVINPQLRKEMETIVSQYPLKKLKSLIDGGLDRQDSVENGLKEARDCDYVILQDGANPTTTDSFIEECLQAAAHSGASTGYTAPCHTVIEIENGFAKQVLERSELGYACSPQIFSTPILERSIRFALENKMKNRPTVELARLIGNPVSMVPCPDKTVKITTWEDFEVAEKILEGRDEFADTRKFKN